MPRAVLLTSVHNPFDTRIFYRQAGSLVRHGYDVTLVAPHDGPQEMVAGVQLVPLTPVRSRWRRPLSWVQLLRIALRLEADIYHLHDPELLLIGPMLQRLSGRPVVYDAHEWYAGKVLLRSYMPVAVRRLMHHVMSVGEPLLARSMTATIAADHLTGQALVSGGVPSVTVLYNYPLPAIYDELYVRREHRVQSHSARREGPVLLFVGVVGVDRGLFLMLRTVAQLKTGWDLKARLRIVGKIRSVALRDRARELIDELGIAEQVEFPGYVPQDRLAPYYEDADLGFMAYNPQVCEYNIPTKMFEYMAAGLPIIGTRAPMTSYFMDTVDAGVLVDSLDPADYARAIHDLWQDPERRQQMARNGRAAFEERFSWASEEAKLLALYSRLLEG